MRLLLIAALLAVAACDDGHGTPGADAGVPHDGPAPTQDAAVGPWDAPVPPPGHGFLRVVALDSETEVPVPARAIITALAPTLPVDFDIDPATGTTLAGIDGANIAPNVIGAPEGVYLTSGDGTFKVPPGSYRVFVTRGPEWEAHVQEIAIDDEHDVLVGARLLHSVDARGWLAADTHIHTGRSFDSKISLTSRVVSEVGVGVSLIVTTDHNVLSDLQPVVESLGYTHLARAIVGDEFNFLDGHGGAFPMPYDPGAEYGGIAAWGLNWELVRAIALEDIAPLLRTVPTNPAVSVYHPRMGGDLGYFNNLKQFGPNGWSPPQPLPSAAVLDGIELMNGYMRAPNWVATVMRDWFFLLSTGHRIAALGGTDTHKLTENLAGFPRTWMRMPSDDPFEVTGQDVGDALRAGRTIASTGPFARLRVNGGDIGDLVPASGGVVQVDATVDAPAWMTVDTVQIWVNGQKARETPVTVGSRPLYQATFSLTVPPGDGWVVLVARGSHPLPPALIGNGESDLVMPLVVTSPVYFDGDGDALWQPQIATPDPGPLTLSPQGLVPGGGLPPELPPPPPSEPPLWADPATWE
ncbi:MAG TPA: CehA/McbA family metallohydrolase [Polyangia bacterium]|jgi:hypothetical protein